MDVHRLRLHAGFIGVVVVALAGCGSGSPATSPTARATAPPTRAPTPAPPDTESVSILTTGLGTWQLVAIPVAILHNDASAHGAEQVVVHFTTRGSGGGTTGALDSEAVNLAPGETLPVAADCTDGCNGSVSAAAAVSVGMWTPQTGASFATGPASYQCGTGACGGGHGEGDVTGELTTTGLAAGASLVAYGVCMGPEGAILGGGVTETLWPGGASTSLSVPVIVNRTPASCQIGASTGW